MRSERPARTRLLAIATAAATMSCTAVLTESSSEETDNSQVPPSDLSTTPASQTEPCSTLPARARRLTPRQFDITMHALLPELDAEPSEGFLDTYADGDPRYGGDVGAQTMSTPQVEDLLETAESLAVHFEAVLPTWAGCDVNSPDCDESIVQALTNRVFRRAPTREEGERLLRFLKSSRTDFGDDAISQLIQTVLLSPSSLFRTETLGEERETMSDYEIASALSYALTDGPPDEILLEAAKKGQLTDPTERQTQAERLLSTPAAGLLRFMDEYVRLNHFHATHLDKDAFPEFDDELKESFEASYRAWVTHLMWEQDAGFEELMTSNALFVNQRLADHYEHAGELGSTLTLARADAATGLIGQGVFLAQHPNDQGTSTSIVKRALIIRDELLCQPPLSPPPDVDDVLPDSSDEAATQRDRLLSHASGSCASCHQHIDAFGFPLETFDALGRSRNEENGEPIDPSAEFTIDETSIVVENAAHLADWLAQSPIAQDCFKQHQLRFLDGEQRPSSCLQTSPGQSLRDNWITTIASPAFIERSPL